MDFDLQKIIHNVSKIKLPGGVVGKICKVLIIVSLSMALIAWSVKLVWVSALALIFIFILCFIMLWRLINFADRNPQAALLEGAEFLVHEQLKLGMKGTPKLEVNPKDSIEPIPNSPNEEDLLEAEQPDTSTSPSENSSSDTIEKEGENG